MKLRDLMEAAYKFLQQEQFVFRELWDWSVCVPLLRSHDTLVRWYVAVGVFLCFTCGESQRECRVLCMRRERKLCKMGYFCAGAFCILISLVMCPFSGKCDDISGGPFFFLSFVK